MMQQVNQPSKDPGSLVGRFIVDFAGARHTGLSAQAVVDLLAESGAAEAVIFRIHRVVGPGRMELVGVSPRLFHTDDGFIFRRREVSAARADFEALCAAAIATPPPSRLRVQLVEVGSTALAHAVVLLFPAPCMEGVGYWLQRCGLHPGDDVEGGVPALQRHLAEGPRVLEEVVLESLP